MAHVIDTASGRKVDLDDPQPDQIELDDIAGGLSRICRFGAQAVRFHSVAQHALLVSRLVTEAGHPELALAALHHDSHEAYVCDIPKPLKVKLRSAGQTLYEEVCDRLDDAIRTALGMRRLSTFDHAVIKEADRRALMMEAAELLPDRGRGISETEGISLEAPGQLGASRTAEEARLAFLDRHHQLAHTSPKPPKAPS